MFIRVYFSLRSVVFFVSFGCRTQQMITGIQVWAGRLQTFPWNWKLGDIQAVKTAFPVEWHFAFTAGWCINFKWYRLHLTAKKSRCFEPSFDGYISSIFWEMPNGVAGPYTFWSQSRSPQCDMMRWKAKRMKAQRTSSLTFGILESTQRWQAVPRVVEDPITTSYFFRKKIYIYIYGDVFIRVFVDILLHPLDMISFPHSVCLVVRILCISFHDLTSSQGWPFSSSRSCSWNRATNALSLGRWFPWFQSEIFTEKPRAQGTSICFGCRNHLRNQFPYHFFVWGNDR